MEVKKKKRINSCYLAVNKIKKQKIVKKTFTKSKYKYIQYHQNIYIYIYIYICVCVCVRVRAHDVYVHVSDRVCVCVCVFQRKRVNRCKFRYKFTYIIWEIYTNIISYIYMQIGFSLRILLT